MRLKKIKSGLIFTQAIEEFIKNNNLFISRAEWAWKLYGNKAFWGNSTNLPLWDANYDLCEFADGYEDEAIAALTLSLYDLQQADWEIWEREE